MKVKIIITNGKTKEGKEFKAYKMVEESTKKLIDCRFTLAVDVAMLKELSTMNKAWIITEKEYSINHNYEFPRIYIADIQSIEKII